MQQRQMWMRALGVVGAVAIAGAAYGSTVAEVDFGSVAFIDKQAGGSVSTEGTVHAGGILDSSYAYRLEYVVSQNGYARIASGETWNVKVFPSILADLTTRTTLSSPTKWWEVVLYKPCHGQPPVSKETSDRNPATPNSPQYDTVTRYDAASGGNVVASGYRYVRKLGTNLNIDAGNPNSPVASAIWMEDWALKGEYDLLREEMRFTLTKDSHTASTLGNFASFVNSNLGAELTTYLRKTVFEFPFNPNGPQTTFDPSDWNLRGTPGPCF